MRKKSFTTRCHVDEDNVPRPCGSVNEETSHSDADSDVVQISPLFLMDSSGRPVLQDGTPVVEPEVVDSVTDENSANSRNGSRIPSSFSPGVMDCVKCTACCYKIQPFTMPFSVHPLLKVLLCNRCTKYCEKQNFAKDESGKDENCKWCSDGGDLVCCDNCSHAICKKCIRQNLGRTYLRNVESLGESDTWNCFVCDPTPIKALQDNCSEIVDKVAEYEAIKKRRSMRGQESRRSRNKSQPNEHTTGDVFNSSSSHMNFMNPNTTVEMLKPTTLPIPDIHCTNVVNPKGIIKIFKVNTPAVVINPAPLTSESIDLHSIFNQISSVNETNVKTALRASQKCLDIFLKDIRRLENNLMRNPPVMELSQVAQSFQSIYKFHLFTRLGNLSARMLEEEELINKTSKNTTIINNNNNKQTISFHPVTILPKVNTIPIAVPISTNPVNMTIDLTNEDSPLKSNTSESGALVVSSQLISTQQTTPTVTNDINNIKSINNHNNDNNSNSNSYKRRLSESESGEKLECGKKRKLGLIIESDSVKKEDRLCKEKKPSEEEDLERELHNLERICTKAINSSLLEQSHSSTVEKEHDESNENLKHDKKNTENTTENENTVNRRVTRRSCKTTDTKEDEFEDDSWSIEDNLNSSFQNNSNNNINADSTFDGSESNDPLVSSKDDAQTLLQDQLERKTNDYLHNLNARDALLKSSSDDDDDDGSPGEGGNDDHDDDVRDDEKAADNNLIKRKKPTPDAINGNSANDNNITEDVTHSSDSNTSQKDAGKSPDSSDPFVRLTRLTNAAVNENLENHHKKANKAHHSSLLDDDEDDDVNEDNKNKDNHDVDLDKHSQSESLSNRKAIDAKPSRRTRRVLSSSESNADDDEDDHHKDNKNGSNHHLDDDDDDEESEQSTSSESHNSKQQQQLKSRHNKVKPNKLKTLRITRSQKQLASGKSKVHRSDDDDRDGGGGGNDDIEDAKDEDDSDNEEDGEKEKKRKQQQKKTKKKADTNSPTDETATKKRQQKSYRKRKLRRVRLANSDESGDDDNNNSEEDDGKDDANLKKAKEDKDKAEKHEEETDEGLDAKGRKKIRRIYTNNKLSEATKAAQASEEERRRRIAERQKMYNEFVVQDGEGINTVTTKLILDPGDPVIEVHPGILKHLKPHQVEAVRFLWDCTIESVEHQKSCNNESSSTTTTGNGAILAHCMGLGKTLSVISFLHTLLRYPKQLNIRTCLIICPVNTLLNWKHEWDMWLPEDEPVDVFELASKGSSRFKLEILENWHKNGGVLIIGYDMFRNFVMTLMKRSRSKHVKTTISSGLLNPGPDIVVCDEGHLMKNAKTHISKAVSQIRTTKRVILTGTPLQNNLNEYHAMVDFVKPNLLGTLKEFNNRFVNPIKNGQHSNSTPRDVNIMKKRAHILYKTLDGCVQRRDYSVLTKYLPPRHEYVIMCRLTKVQQELYAYYLENFNDLDITKNNNRDDTHRRKTLFTVQQTLYRISTHPYALRIHETKEARKMLLMSEDSFIDDSANSLESSSTSSNSAPSDTSEDDDDDDDGVADADDIVGKKKTKIDENGDDDDVDQKTKENNNNSTVNKKSLSRRRRRLRRPLTRQEAKNPTTVILDSDSNDDDDNDDDDDSDSVTDIDGSQKPWWYQFYKDEYDWQINVGAKMDVLFNILKRCSDIGDKVILFSHSLISLDLIEKFLAEISRQWSVLQNQSSDQKTEENVENAENADTLNRPDLSSYFSDIGHNTWIRGLDYERMDGSMNVNVRKDLQARFNSTSNTRLRLFIISTKAGGLGINLIAANRLVLLDASWNPSHDIQSIFRSYRFGQHKPVYIYRLIAQGTIEEKIYDRQVTKQSLSLRVVDELQIDRHFSDDDLQKLFTFEPDIWNPEDDNDSDKRPTPLLPKDRLLADMLTEYRHLIATYHNHDSLLQHREDEGLTEVERQEAWREYEEEKQYGMSLAEHQRLVMLQQQWIAQQQQQIQQQQQLFHLQYLQQQQQQQQYHHQQQQHQLQHFILPNFQFPTVSSPNTSGQTIVISDDNSNHSNNDSQVVTSPPVVHSGNVVVPNKNTKKNTKNTNTAVTNPGSPTMAMATMAASANNSTRNTTDLHHSAGSQLITDISTTTTNNNNNNTGSSSTSSSASVAVHPSRIQQARYITPAINNLPSNAYGRMYSQVRRGAILKDPSLISDPEKLDKLTMNKLVSVLTTPVLVNTDDVHDPSSFTMMRSNSKASHNPQSKN